MRRITTCDEFCQMTQMTNTILLMHTKEEYIKPLGEFGIFIRLLELFLSLSWIATGPELQSGSKWR